MIIAVLVLVGGYFVFTNSQNQSATPETTTTQEQPVKTQVELTIDYAGEVEKETEVKTVEIDEGDTAWDVLVLAIGEENVGYQDYGGDLGIFVQSIDGVKPKGSKFWLFKVNGKGADVGVSAYKVKSGDKIEFEISKPSEGQ